MVNAAVLAVLAVGFQQTMAQGYMRQFVLYTAAPQDDTAVERMDPIVAPGGVSAHVHSFFGANNNGSEVSYESLQQSSCTMLGSVDGRASAQDKSLYWHPALYMKLLDGTGYIRVPMNSHKVYYQDMGDEMTSDGFNFPQGFRMVAGDSYRREPVTDFSIIWSCYGDDGVRNEGTNGGFPKVSGDCSTYPYLMGQIDFPHCWNGDEFDQNNASAHMAYKDIYGKCPSSHPTRLPHILMENLFNVSAVFDSVELGHFVLAQGDPTGYGYHADFFNGWDDGAIEYLMADCMSTGQNFDVGVCSGFVDSGLTTSECTIPLVFEEEVNTPGDYLPGCNPESQYKILPENQQVVALNEGCGGPPAKKRGSPLTPTQSNKPKKQKVPKKPKEPEEDTPPTAAEESPPGPRLIGTGEGRRFSVSPVDKAAATDTAAKAKRQVRHVDGHRFRRHAGPMW